MPVLLHAIAHHGRRYALGTELHAFIMRQFIERAVEVIHDQARDRLAHIV